MIHDSMKIWISLRSVAECLSHVVEKLEGSRKQEKRAGERVVFLGSLTCWDFPNTGTQTLFMWRDIDVTL